MAEHRKDDSCGWDSHNVAEHRKHNSCGWDNHNKAELNQLF